MRRKLISRKLMAAAVSAALFVSPAVSAVTALSVQAATTSYTSSTGGENAYTADGTTADLTGVTVTKTGDSNSEDADFYGTNAAVLAKNGANLTIKNSTISTAGQHANGVFSYGSETTVNISDSTITTTGNNSGGIMTTGGGTTNAENLTITTSGNSSAAIRSDRGGGTVKVDNGTYTTNGKGSPSIYSTADITVSGATLTANDSEAVVIEGGNSVTLNNDTVTGNDADLNGQSTNKTNVLIYQSMSGDASEGSSAFTMSGGKLIAKTGDMFWVTNTTTTINLTGVEMTYANGNLLTLSSGNWGTSGSNGGNATVNAKNQTLQGTIAVDDDSTLNLILSGDSTYTGAINTENTNGKIYAAVPEGTTWTLTDDSYVTSLTAAANSINLNGHKLYVNGTEYTAGTASTGEQVTATSSGSGSSGGGQNQPDGQTPPDGKTPPDKPDGDNGNGQEPPEKPENKNSEASTADTDSAAAQTQAMYRLYNPNSGEHFYTANASEKDSLVSAGWNYEGVGWYAPTSGTAVYRLYNANAGDHHYTTNAGEKDALVKLGWTYEGVGWYSAGSDDENAVAVYREYNPNVVSGAHNFTTNRSEHNYLVSIGWKNEGIAWYGVSE